MCGCQVCVLAGRWEGYARHRRRTLDEIACAMNFPLGSAVKLSKAVHGLGNAPRSWWLSVDKILTSIGGRRNRTDPTVWCFSSEVLGTTCALVAACVGDFITGFAGTRFEQLKSGLRDRFRCSWKLQSLGLCGVRVHKKVDHMIVLDQTSYVNSGINPINVDTHRDLDRSLPTAEIANPRSVWSAMQWNVTQTGPQHAAAFSELQYRRFHNPRSCSMASGTSSRTVTRERRKKS